MQAFKKGLLDSSPFFLQLLLWFVLVSIKEESLAVAAKLFWGEMLTAKLSDLSWAYIHTYTYSCVCVCIYAYDKSDTLVCVCMWHLMATSVNERVIKTWFLRKSGVGSSVNFKENWKGVHNCMLTGHLDFQLNKSGEKVMWDVISNVMVFRYGRFNGFLKAFCQSGCAYEYMPLEMNGRMFPCCILLSGNTCNPPFIW